MEETQQICSGRSSQPEQGNVWTLLAELPGQAVSQQPGLGHEGCGGQEAGHAVPEPALEADLSEQYRQSCYSLGLGFSGLKAALVLLKPRGSVSLQKVSPKNCRPVSEIICKQFVHSHMENLWQDGNTMWTSISQPSVLITKLYFPDIHLLSYFFLYQKHSFYMSISFSAAALQGWISVIDHFFHTEYWGYSNEFSL